ncbi:unnamed protein product [Lymnaea stagnalis]|uniref:Uncharacterized protein n=1 Tax=Lymnaea stagnalis TaxID=6523 RepID=A0AAV2IN41_LYMST
MRRQHSKVTRRFFDGLCALQGRYRNYRRKRKFGRVSSENSFILTDAAVGVPAEDAQSVWLNLKTKTASVLHDFSGETTAHGYKRTISPQRSKTFRILWVLLIMSVTGVALNTLYSIVTNQQLNTFSSNFRSEPKRRMSFPAVTVCNIFPRDMSWIAWNTSENHSEKVLDISDDDSPGSTPDWPKYPHFNTETQDDLLGWKLDSFIIKCSWNNEPVNCSDVLVRTLSSLMACYTFNSDPENSLYTDLMGSSSGLELLVRVVELRSQIHKGSPTGVKVLLHGPQEFPNTQDQGILVAPNSVAYISVDKTQYKFLPKPYMAYGTEYCNDYSSETEPAFRYYNRTGHTWCMAECRLREVIVSCGCLPYPGDPAVPGVPYCTLAQYTCYVDTLNRIHMWSPYNHTNCSCPLPCNKEEYTGRISTALYTPGGGQLDTGSYVLMKIFYEDLFVHVEEHIPKYTWPDIFGTVGGQIGLFTGASVLTVLEFVELGWLMTVLGGKTLYTRLKAALGSRASDVDNTVSAC